MAPSKLFRGAAGVAAAGTALLAPIGFHLAYPQPAIAVFSRVPAPNRLRPKTIAPAPAGAAESLAHTTPFPPAAVASRSEAPPDSLVAFAPASDGLAVENPAAQPGGAAALQMVFRNALAAYDAGDLGAGDVLASEIPSPLARTALEWAALHAPADIGFQRYASFLALHPKWPAADWVAREAEEALWRDRSSPERIVAFFTGRKPETAMGELALARADLAQGRKDQAAALVRDAWRNDDLFPALEGELRKEFGALLTADDDKYRAERLLYRGETAAALRAAARAGTGVLALARARIAAMEGRASPTVMNAVPADLRRDPSYLFAQIERLRGAKQVKDAAKLMLGAPRDPKVLIDPDAWWLQRRWIARKMLDLGEAQTAYQLCANYAPGTSQTDLDAEFHAGWIALRFLSDPKEAEPHFEKLAALAQTPVSKARAGYWLGRAEEALHSPKALADFRAAAAYSTTYYGQLAQAAIGGPPPPLRAPTRVAAGDARDEAIRVVELLGYFGDSNEALSLAIQTAHALDRQSQLAALAQVGKELDDARETLAVGKVAERRGFALDNDAFPIFGVPQYPVLAHSAPPAIVYAVARQESAFQTNAMSTAGARGLMQMILSTARRTAQRFRIPFDPRRLTRDPAFNAELGAAHLGQLLSEQRGSLILTFAAYNAGGRRVQQWIDAYGDPRRPGVDPVDWVERIPIAETRDYVQRVMENFNVYKARFAALDDRPVLTARAKPPSPPAASLGPAIDAPISSSQAKL